MGQHGPETPHGRGRNRDAELGNISGQEGLNENRDKYRHKMYNRVLKSLLQRVKYYSKKSGRASIEGLPICSPLCGCIF